MLRRLAALTGWLLALLAVAGLIALGNWQLRRLDWKRDLIARIEQRLQAAPVPAPGPAEWRTLAPAQAEYRRVTVEGRYRHDAETLVQATTVLGAGYWVLTPLEQPGGSAVLVNRGFVSPDRRDPAARGALPPVDMVRIEGLLRLSEPDGGFLRRNAPAEDRWHSRDVAAIAARRQLPAAAPYFIDEGLAQGPGTTALLGGAPAHWPVAGLTVVSFNNHHLIYALTWYGLALMTAAAAAYLGLDRRRRRKSSPPG